jgi:hypothetical protein
LAKTKKVVFKSGPRHGRKGYRVPRAERVGFLKSRNLAEPWLSWHRARVSKIRELHFQLLEQQKLPDLNSSAGVTLDPTTELQGILDIWKATREAVKPRLEAIIAELTKVEHKTFEEKRQTADLLRSVMESFAFRPISPITGNPSVLRVRQSARTPRGFFSFDEPPTPKARPTGTGAVDTSVSQRNARGGTAQLVAFLLTDRPPDRRRSSAKNSG